jgi:hypothetical protein
MPMISILDVLDKSIPNFDACVAWATEEGYKIHKVYCESESKQMAERLQKEWEQFCLDKKKWDDVSIPSVKHEAITVQKLHEYLTEIMKLHPNIASCPVNHEECCGNTETYMVTFDYGKGCVVLS